MAQQLWLLRHGDAEPHGTRDDHDRKLSERGIEQARAAGKALAALGFEPTAVLTSPKVRARDTAAEACGALLFKAVEFEPLAGGFDGAAALDLCGPEHGDRVLINHFVTRPNGISYAEDSAIVNTKAAIVARANACKAARGMMPTIIAVNNVELGDVVGAAKTLNGLG